MNDIVVSLKVLQNKKVLLYTIHFTFKFINNIHFIVSCFIIVSVQLTLMLRMITLILIKTKHAAIADITRHMCFF